MAHVDHCRNAEQTVNRLQRQQVRKRHLRKVLGIPNAESNGSGLLLRVLLRVRCRRTG